MLVGQRLDWTWLVGRVAEQRRPTMAGKEFHVQHMGIRVIAADKRIRQRPLVQTTHVVDFLKRILDDFPIGLDLGPPGEGSNRTLTKGITG